MPEVLTYTTQQAQPSIVSVQIIGLEMYRKPTPMVRFILEDNVGRVFDAYYREDEGALDLIKLFNTRNFSTTSMNKQALQKLATDGKLAPGAASGTDD